MFPPNISFAYSNDRSEVIFRTSTETITFQISLNDVIEVNRAYYTNPALSIDAIEIPLTAAKEIGHGNHARKVYHYLNRQFVPSNGLRAGLTIHSSSSTWSSLPHDFELNPELGFEEIFFFHVSGGTNKGLQIRRGVWFDGTAIDDISGFESKDFLPVPMGYHPVVGEPNVLISYLWCYIAKYEHWEKLK